MEQVWMYDTTLRDGAQGEGVSFTVADKLEVVRLLDDLRVDYIEGGWPGSNAKDLEFFYELRSLPLHHSRVVAFTSTRKKGSRIEEDAHMQMVLGTGLEHCAVVGKTWDFHVKTALRTDLRENLAMIRDTIAFLKERGIEALFDAEHFFDGYKHNPDYALQALATARDAGADWLILCDTNGGMLPHQITEIVEQVKRAGFASLGIHAHNDGAVAVANTLAAVRAGATQVQGTINGFGERCGNTDLCAVLPNLVMKMHYSCPMGQSIGRLKEVSERLYAITGKTPAATQPFVGKSAFAHKAGIHVSAILRNPTLYEHIVPETVGNVRRVLVSELSGASNVTYQLEQMGLPSSPEIVTRILARIKESEQLGYVFEEAEASLELLIQEALGSNPACIEQVRAGVEPVDEGFSVSLEWLENGDAVRRVRGLGVTEAQAFCQAAGLYDWAFSLQGESVLPLATLGGREKFRARIEGVWNESHICTVGLGGNRGEALAIAVMDVYRYILLKTRDVSSLSSVR